MRVAVVATAICLSIVGLAEAKGANAAIKMPTNIPAQGLGPALKTFAQERNLQVLYFSQTVRGMKTGGASGELTADEALTQLLSGTGLVFQYVDDKAVTILAPGAKDQVVPTTSDDPHREKTAPQEGKKSSSGGFLAGQMDQGANPQPSSLGNNVSIPQEQSVKLEEIIVTARKREERLIDTPQSVSVLSSDQLSQLGASQFRDFANTVPGLTFSTAGPGYTQVSLRGVTLGQDTSPTIGIYVDDVPFGSSTGFAQGAQLALDVGLFDIDRIEILRGPQGTLYGASTMGGLIKYVSRQPDPSGFSGTAQAGVAYTDAGGVGYNVAGVANVPLVSDVAALRASVFESHEGGYIDNVALDRKDANRSDVYGGRLDFLVRPTDRLTIRLGAFLQNISRDGQATADYTLAGRPEYGALDQYRLIPEPFNQQFRVVDLTVGYDFGFGALTSISSYQTQQTHTDTDYSAAFVPLLDILGFGTYRSVGAPQWVGTDKFTQEIRLASSGGEMLDWLVGAFYTHESSQNVQSFEVQDPASQPVPNTFFNYSGPTHYDEYAGFGDVTWHIASKVDVSGGIRFAHNSQAFTQFGSGVFGSSEPTRKSEENVVTYLADARYHVSDHATGYIRYATGYRPGGPNFVANDPVTGKAVAPATFEADRLKSYEIGFKAETADRRYAIDAAGYWIDWSNIQVLTTVDNFSVYANASGGAYIPGAELTLTARPIDPLTIRAGLAYNHAHLRKDEPDVGGLEGERLPNVPRFTASGNLDYVIWPGGVKPTVGTTLRYVSGRDSSFDNSLSNPQYHLPAYTAVDLRGSLKFRSVDVQLYVHNLSNERGQLSATTNFGFAEVALIEPLTLGINATVHF